MLTENSKDKLCGTIALVSYGWNHKSQHSIILQENFYREEILHSGLDIHCIHFMLDVHFLYGASTYVLPYLREFIEQYADLFSRLHSNLRRMERPSTWSMCQQNRFIHRGQCDRRVR